MIAISISHHTYRRIFGMLFLRGRGAMKIWIFAVSVAVLPQLSQASNLYRYNEANGLCENSKGELGLNPQSFQELKVTASGECADLRTIFIQDDSETPHRGWNLQGANLNQAKVLNVVLESADLRGTKMESMTGVYSYFEGKADSFTRLPDKTQGGHSMGNIDRGQGFPEITGPPCQVASGHLDCGQY